MHRVSGGAKASEIISLSGHETLKATEELYWDWDWEEEEDLLVYTLLCLIALWFPVSVGIPVPALVSWGCGWLGIRRLSPLHSSQRLPFGLRNRSKLNLRPSQASYQILQFKNIHN